MSNSHRIALWDAKRPWNRSHVQGGPGLHSYFSSTEAAAASAASAAAAALSARPKATAADTSRELTRTSSAGADRRDVNADSGTGVGAGGAETSSIVQQYPSVQQSQSLPVPGDNSEVDEAHINRNVLKVLRVRDEFTVLGRLNGAATPAGGDYGGASRVQTAVTTSDMGSIRTAPTMAGSARANAGGEIDSSENVEIRCESLTHGACQQQQPPQQQHNSDCLAIAGSDVSELWTGWLEGAVLSANETSARMIAYLQPPEVERNMVRRIPPPVKHKY